MDITKYKFQEIDFDIPTDETLLEEAVNRGFYGGHTKYNDLFNEFFFNGGKLNFKDGLDPDFKQRTVAYLGAFMHSFTPKHEEKEAISALLLSELMEIK